MSGRDSKSTKKEDAATNCGSATGNPRNKVALKPGHSLMDWIRLGNSGADLTGVGGIMQDVTHSQLSEHCMREDAWLAIRGKVYNVTRYMDFHPGGSDELMRGVGRDATDLFNEVHPWVNYNSILQKCVVGRLRRGSATCDDLAAVLFSNKKKKSSNAFLIPHDKAAPGSQAPHTDWFQKLASLTLVLYPSATLPAFPQVRVQLRDGRDVRIRIRQGPQAFVVHCKLEAEVTWPCRVEVNRDTGKVEITLNKSSPRLWTQLGEPREDDGTALRLRPEEEGEAGAEVVHRTYTTMSVVSVQAVTHNTKLLVLCHKDNTYDTIPLGHHVLVRCEVAGVDVVRPYTPVPPSLHEDSRPACWHPGCICLMVKGYPSGTVSSWLCDLQVGHMVPVSEVEGTFHPRVLAACNNLYLVAAGTGLTPMLGLLQWALETRTRCQSVKLLFLNRTPADILWYSQLDRLAAEDSRFSVLHVLSDAAADWNGQRGRIDLPLLQAFLPATIPDAASPPGCYICVCGPAAFTQVTQKNYNHVLLKHQCWHAQCAMTVDCYRNWATQTGTITASRDEVTPLNR